MKVCVIGLGYIGLPTSAMFAKSNVEVLGVDRSKHIVEVINSGNIHIEEPGLKEVIKEVVANRKLRAALTPEEADAFIIAVPTPNNEDEHKSCDLEHVLSATESIIPYLKKGNVIIIESTIAPRSTEDYVKPLIEKNGLVVGTDVFLAHCPERVLPGKILNEIVYNNRIVGGITEKCTEEAAKIYEVLVKGEIIKTEAKTAEMSKLMENTFRDVNIALANELAKVCNELDINVLDVISMANKHPRVNIHTPGPGVGGHCLAVDPYFIYAKTPKIAKLIKLSRDINTSMPEYVVNNVEKILKKDKSKKVAVFGVTYKADVDDIRESPAMEIIHMLIKSGYNIDIYDPHVENENFKSFDEALNGAELLLCLVDHSEFRTMDYLKLKKLMKNPLIFDTRGFLEDSDIVCVMNYGNMYKFL